MVVTLQRLPKKKHLNVYKVQRKWKKGSATDLTAGDVSPTKGEVPSMTTPSQQAKEAYSTASRNSSSEMIGEFSADKSTILPTTTDESAGEEYPIERMPRSNKQGQCLFFYLCIISSAMNNIICSLLCVCCVCAGGERHHLHVRWGPSEESEEDLSSSNPPITTSPEFSAVINQVITIIAHNQYTL